MVDVYNINPIITRGLNDYRQAMVITRGYGPIVRLVFVLLFRHMTDYMRDNSVANMDFEVNEETYTFTRVSDDDAGVAGHHWCRRGWCYVADVRLFTSSTILMPSYINVSDGNGDTLKFHFCEWVDDNLADRQKHVTVDEVVSNDGVLIVEYAIKGGKVRRPHGWRPN